MPADPFDVARNDTPSVIADYTELATLMQKDGNVSEEELARELKRPGYISEENARALASAVFLELVDRQKMLSGLEKRRKIFRWPFLLEDGEVLQVHHKPKQKSDASLVYLFLMLICRHNMSSTTRTLAKEDPTRLFEELCRFALQGYLGPGSQVFLMGTAAGKTFKARISALIRQMSEGSKFLDQDTSPAGDRGLDVAAWRPFGDSRSGKVLVFAQCKTGDDWEKHLGDLDTVAFCRSYFVKPPPVFPIKAYMTPWHVYGQTWTNTTLAGGLILDRIRLLHSLSVAPRPAEWDDLIDRIRAWTTACIDLMTARYGS